MGDAFDDARVIDGCWYYRNIIARDFRPFRFQRRVVPLRKNPPRAVAKRAK
jgi:hypothetical protein